MQKFNPRTFWDNITPTKKRFPRFLHLKTNLDSALRSLSQSQDISGSGEIKKRLRWVLKNLPGGYPGRDMDDQVSSALRTLQKVGTIGWEERSKGSYVTEEKLDALGFTEAVYLRTLRQVSEFFAWAFELVVPEIIRDMYSNIELEEVAIPREELERLSQQDLFDHPDTRFPLVFILDNALYMEKNLDKLWDGLDSLIEEIRCSSHLQDSIEMYIVTCGGKVTEVVSFANLRRQEAILDQMELVPFGPCKMADAISLALDKLNERISVMQDEDTNVDFYCPWMIILSGGKFRDDMTDVSQRLREMIDNEMLEVYVRGIGDNADMDRLRSITGEAMALTSVNGFFKDVFTSLKKSEYSIPGGSRFHLTNQEGFSLK